jgi:hypothetical protein
LSSGITKYQRFEISSLAFQRFSSDGEVAVDFCHTFKLLLLNLPSAATLCPSVVAISVIVLDAAGLFSISL